MKLLILDGDNKVYILVENVADVVETGFNSIKWVDTTSPYSSPSYENIDPSFELAYLVVEDNFPIERGDTAPYDLLLQYKKERRKKALDAVCVEVLYGGCTVTSTGNVYSTLPADLQFIGLKATYITMFPNDTNSFHWATLNNGKVLHTPAEFKNVCAAMNAHLTTTVEHLWSLQSDVDQATTLEEVADISW